MYNLLIIKNDRKYHYLLKRKIKHILTNKAIEYCGKIEPLISKAFYNYYNSDKKIPCSLSYKEAIYFDKLLNEQEPLLYNLAKQHNHNKYRRTTRFRDKINTMFGICKYLNYNCYFLTFTFRDDVLDNTNEETRRRYISRLLRDNFTYYLANIDYGKANEREHYHALAIVPNNIRFNIEKLQKYGFFYYELVNLTTTDNKKISLYMTKLWHHAYKRTTKDNRIIYSCSEEYKKLHIYFRKIEPATPAIDLLGKDLKIV